jgi:hypothetical protein
LERLTMTLRKGPYIFVRKLGYEFKCTLDHIKNSEN